MNYFLKIGCFSWSNIVFGPKMLEQAFAATYKLIESQKYLKVLDVLSIRLFRERAQKVIL